MLCYTVKPVLSGHSKEDQKLVFKNDYHLIQVKNIAECSKREHSAILSTFIKLPFVFKTFVLSIFEWPLKTGLTVLYPNLCLMRCVIKGLHSILRFTVFASFQFGD